MFCRSWRYPLHDLDSNACPECGRSFDPDNPKTYMTEAMTAREVDREAARMCVMPIVFFLVGIVVMGAALLFLIEILLSA